VTGLVSLVGVGPGDPGLLTLRGARVIARADVVVYDALLHPAVLRHARPDAERLFVGKRKGAESATQEEINHLLLYRATQGRRVARLKGGDPMLFGRGAEECEFLSSHGVPFEIVPGVTAALGATAYAGIPLSHRDLSSSIALVTATERPGKLRSAHDWSRLAAATQTLVLYMGVHRLREDLAALVAHGRDGSTPAAVISWGTHPEQRVVSATVATLADACEAAPVAAPALVVVGDVVALRERLRWWDVGPLFGRRVVVTRAKEQSPAMVDALVEEGAEALEFPAIGFEPASDEAPLARAIDDLAAGRYAAALFTSHNGVDRFFRALDARSLDARTFGRTLVAAIGPATAESLRSRGVRADLVAKEFVGEALARDVLTALGDRATGARALLARAEVARDALPDALRAAAVEVDVVPVYKTVAAPADDIASLRARLAEGAVDAVTFTSSSTVTNVCDALGDDAAALLARTVVASIGPVTSKTARARGLTVAVEAETYTVAGLLDALRAHFSLALERP
jgi:uroporphyrinogen III methyltransferase/synthase